MLFLTKIIELAKNELPATKVALITKTTDNETLFLKSYFYLKNRLLIQTSDPKRRKRLMDVAYQLTKNKRKKWNSAIRVVVDLKRKHQFDFSKISEGMKSKLMTLIYGIPRGSNLYTRWKDLIDLILNDFELSNIQKMDNSEKQKLLTACFYLSQGIDGKSHYQEILIQFEKLFGISEEQIKNDLGTKEKLRLITAAYAVALGKEEGVKIGTEVKSKPSQR